MVTTGSKTHMMISLLNNHTIVLAFIMLYEKREDNLNKYYKVLSCVIYTIIKNYVYIDYLAFQSKILNVIPLGLLRGF